MSFLINIEMFNKAFSTTALLELSVSKNELLYISSNAVYSQKTDGEEIIAVHFINYNKKDKTGCSADRRHRKRR